MQSPLKEFPQTLDGQSLRVLVWERDLVDMWCLDEEGNRTPFRGKGSTWHFHADLELTMISQGHGVLYVGDHIGRFSAPDCILLGKDVPHVWKCDGVMSGISLQFPMGASSAFGALPEFANLGRLWSRSALGLRWQGATAQALHGQLLKLEKLPALERLARFIAIVDTMHRGHPADAVQLSTQILAQETMNRRGAAMQQVLDHIIDHYREDLHLDALVRMSGGSQATFCRHFSQLTGKTFIAYVNAIRIQEARRALVETERSVTDIAFSSGFNNLSHFHAAFRKAAGCTPLAFRKRHAAR